MKKYCIYILLLSFTLNVLAMEKSPKQDLALMNAITDKRVEGALQLIAQGAPVNIQTTQGYTALMYAVGGNQITLVQALIGAGAHINTQGNGGMSALLCAVVNGYEAMVQVLIAAGAAINAQDIYGWTALSWAASFGRTAILKELLKAGADVNAQAWDSMTALMHAADKGYSQVVKILIASAADITAQDSTGTTALNLAAINGHVEIARTLIAAGAHVSDTLPDYFKYAAFATHIHELFACARDLSLAQDVDSATSSLKPDILRRINQLVKTHKLPLDCIDPEGNTLLHYAVLAGNRVAISLVLYLMIKYDQLYALEHRDKLLTMTPIEMAVAKGGDKLLSPFFNVITSKKS